jgi:hypothetical protein
MSMSMSKSLREDSQFVNQSQYKFNAPYVAGLSANLSPIPGSYRERNNEIKRQMNNYMPTPASSHRHTGRTSVKSQANNRQTGEMTGTATMERERGRSKQNSISISNKNNNTSISYNNQMDKSRSKNKFGTANDKSVHNPYNVRSASSSGEKERNQDRKMSPYFKK